MKDNAKNTPNLANLVTLTITKGELLVVSWLVTNIPGLDKEMSRKVGRIIDVFDLENFSGIKQDEKDKTQQYVLSGYELIFLDEALEKAFNDKKVTPAFAKASLMLSDVFKRALEETKVSEE